MNKRSNLSVMMKLIVLVKPLLFYMFLAILTGVLGNFAASMIMVMGGAIFLKFVDMDVLDISYKALVTIMFVFAASRGVLRYLEQSNNHYIAFKLLALLRDKVYKKLRELSPAKLEGKNKGDLISIITSDIELLEVFYAHTISPFFIALIFAIIFVYIITLISYKLAILAGIAYFTIGILIPFVMSKLSRRDGLDFRENAGKLSSVVLDNLRGLSEIIQYNSKDYAMDKMDEYTKKLSKTESKMKNNVGINTAVTNSMILLFDFSMLFLAITLYKNAEINFAGVVMSTLLLMSSFGPFVALAMLGSTLQNTIASGNRVLDILEESPVIEEVHGKERTNYTCARVDKVDFAYDDIKILSDVSVNFEENKITALVGKSGSGKSTLLKLLMRFWDVNSGEVKISDKNIKEINTSDLRNMESFVTQETYLFNRSIKENIIIAKLDATDEEIIEACKKASVHDFITNLPNGYDTKVGELGDALSGGERQRIGLARAFLSNAKFMLLDEPTSNLDSLNEAQIIKSLYESKEDKTIVLVSHRESTVKMADYVYSMDNGRVS